MGRVHLARLQPKREDAKFLQTSPNGRIYVDRDDETCDWAGTYWARYVGHRHDTGPFSLPASARLAAADKHKKAQEKAQQSDAQKNDKPDENSGDSLKRAA